MCVNIASDHHYVHTAITNVFHYLTDLTNIGVNAHQQCISRYQVGVELDLTIKQRGHGAFAINEGQHVADMKGNMWLTKDKMGI